MLDDDDICPLMIWVDDMVVVEGPNRSLQLGISGAAGVEPWPSERRNVMENFCPCTAVRGGSRVKFASAKAIMAQMAIANNIVKRNFIIICSF